MHFIKGLVIKDNIQEDIRFQKPLSNIYIYPLQTNLSYVSCTKIKHFIK